MSLRPRPLDYVFLLILLAGVSGASPALGAGEELVQRGRQVYEQSCLECHGDNGEGNGPRAERLGRRPRNFTLGAFKCRSTPSGTLPTDDDLLRVVNSGLPGTPMRGFERTLEESDRLAVIAYIKTFSPGFGQGAPDTGLSIPQPPYRTLDSVEEGQIVYRLLRCWNCHGPQGGGDGPAAASLKDQWGDPIRAYDFTRWNRFKCGGDEEDLYRLLHTGMSGSPMPSFTTAFGFASDSVGDLDALEVVFPGETQSIRDWLSGQPDSPALRAMSADDRTALIERRTWALIHYLRSLVRGG